MAELAETLKFEKTPLQDLDNMLSGYPMAEILYFPHRIDANGPCSAEDIPFLANVRQQASEQATEILARRRQDLRDGRFELVPLDVDAISTAEKAEAVAGQFGRGSQEHKLARQALVMDYSRKWAEATRKNTWEYFGVDTQEYDPETGMVFADGLSVDEMLENGLTPLTEAEETELRKNDFVIHEAKKAILETESADEVAVIRVTPCPDWAIRSLEQNPKGAHGGYAPEIEKLMVHFDWFDGENSLMHHQQIGVSGKHITLDVINHAFAELGLAHRDRSKTEIHATQVLINKEKMQDGFEFMVMLDQIASEKSGKNIFMGEVVEQSHPKDYQAAAAEALQRQQENAAVASELAAFVETLQAKNMDHAMATIKVENYIQDKLLKMSEDNPSLARIVFDEATATGFEMVKLLQERGSMREAETLRAQVRQEAPAASSCGAGSCGLDEVEKSLEGKVKKLLDAKSDETLTKDTERACQNCGKKQIYYAHTKEVVKKGCNNCGAVEVNGKRKTTDRKTFTFMSANKKTTKIKY